MAKQRIVWTALPFGRTKDGRLRVSVVVSPRLTPETASEQTLAAFPDFLDWPGTLKRARLSLRVGATTIPLQALGTPESRLWRKLFDKTTPVAGFAFQDMSKVNLRSYPTRNVLRFVRRNYARLAVQAATSHPTLLPWKSAAGPLKDMLTEAGTRTQTINLGDRQIELPLPGFSRFFGGDGEQSLDKQLRANVFGPDSRYRAPLLAIAAPDDGPPTTAGEFPLRVLPPDWNDPAGGGADAPVMSQFSTAEEYTLYQAMRFYRREPPSAAERTLRRPSFTDVAAAPKPPEFDFHRIVASYGDMPALLRALGLILDFALPASSPIDAMIGSGSAAGLIRVQVAWSSPQAGTDATPRTAWQGDKERFLTRPRTADHQRGLLRLEGSNDRYGADKRRNPFDLHQVDPEGTALKTVDFVVSAQGLVAKSLRLGTDGDVTYTTGNDQPVAALRSGGLGLSRHGRAAQVATDAAAAALKNSALGGASAGNVVLFLEDVMRGYRVDVAAVPDAVSAGKWLSLCERSSTWTLIKSGEKLSFPDDEGYVSGASTTSTASEDVDPDDHYLNETMFRWTGWSLAAPRPGRTLRAEKVPDSELQAEVTTEVTDTADNGNGIAVRYTARKGSLPKLRFGQLYRLRARVVDLAGNSLARDDASLGELENATDAVGYWRFEPVDPPVLVQRGRVSEGESLERMVIRSNWNADTAAYLSSPDFAAATGLPASQDFEYGAVNERHVVPPKSSQLQCEQHGLFDPLFGDPAAIRTAYGIAAREAGSLYDNGPGTQVELITPASVAEVATTDTLPPQGPSAANPVGDRLAGGQYVVHREALVPTPYLPDGAAGGIALRAAPGHALPGVSGPMVLGPSAAVVLTPSEELVLVVAYGKAWPDTVGLRIRLAERTQSVTPLPCGEGFADTGVPHWNEATRELTLFVPKGRIVRLRYASLVHKDFLDAFGLPSWVDSAGERIFVRVMAQLGCHWMLSPYRTLTLVHATQQPVCEPELLKLGLARALGDHHAQLRSPMRLHGPSTGKFEIEAEWDEWIDDLERPGPELLKASRGQLGEVQLGENHANEFDLNAAVNAQIIANRDRGRGDRHEFGDTKFRLVRYRVRATTRFREYLPAAIYDQRDLVTRLGPVAEGMGVKVGADDDPGAPVLLDAAADRFHTIVPATAPPEDPAVLYTVPTFRWQTIGGSANALDITRFGNGLRVWLDRPWFTSGTGELLGVVMLGENEPFTAVTSALLPFVTQWGMDPLWDTATPKPRIRAADFPARVISETVPLRERPERLVQVVGHRVHWDAARRLWYCDIELDPGASYMPFVRLALARYQPFALAGAKISKVQLGEFAQVLPRRRAVFSRSGAKVSVRLHGNVPHFGPMQFPGDSEYADISFVTGPHETGRNKVELVLQTRDPAIDSDLAWSDAAVLASAVLVPPGTAPVQPPIGGIFSEPVARGRAPKPTVQNRLGAVLDLDAVVDVGPIIRRPDIIGALDPAVWSTEATLPATGGKTARLMLREFERFYTDRTVPEVRSGAVRRRRVIEERLVYATLFELG